MIDNVLDDRLAQNTAICPLNEFRNVTDTFRSTFLASAKPEFDLKRDAPITAVFKVFLPNIDQPGFKKSVLDISPPDAPQMKENVSKFCKSMLELHIRIGLITLPQ